MEPVLTLLANGSDVYETEAFIDVLGWAGAFSEEAIEIVTSRAARWALERPEPPRCADCTRRQPHHLHVSATALDVAFDLLERPMSRENANRVCS